ncbi:hypothetical protein GCM10012275_39450 [Longimycelium tulufanense]|uniref:HTH cro/C1-type domain-containing protein n=1 Tax=Longimycelium tulufanense TaxID=907463 RepID=A0A8J3CDX3_9PSEU|nr:helix-turn-helix transcriptional regulator [Longimycelium tulufanense]GGM65022.1 hypothetical protein GCM10012275_39450 [Longimycelium tulufanense]
MAARVRVRVDAFAEVAAAQGLRSRYALAKRLRVSQSTIGRVLDGESQPGGSFIAATLAGLRVPFDAVFEVEDTGNAGGVAA